MSDTSNNPPWNFSWVIENEIAAMGWPKKLENLIFLAQEGVRHLITLSEEMKPPIQQFSGLKWTLISVEEFESPSEEDIKKFIEICQECRRKKWVRHKNKCLYLHDTHVKFKISVWVVIF